MTFWSSMTSLRFFLLFLLAVFSGLEGWSQVSNISPYSRFGLGDIHDQSYTEQFSMGGLAIPVTDPFALNVANPASYTSLARPIFGVGMRMQLLNLNTAEDTQFNQNHTINNLAVAFPLARKRWGLAAGVMPYTTIGYNITQQVLDPEIGDEIRFEYSGEGGLTRAFIGNAYRIFEEEDTLGNRTGLSVGANISYIFGSVDRVRRSIYPSGSPAFNLRVRDGLRIDDFDLEFGVNYYTNLKKQSDSDPAYIRLNLGATFRVPHVLNSSGDLLAETYTLSSAGNAEILVDTVSYIDYDQNGLNIPMAIGAGAALDIVNKKFQKFMIGVEYRTERWSDFNSGISGEGRVFDELSDSHRVVAGVDFLPNAKVSRRIFSKIHYRMGVRYQQMNLRFENEAIDAYGITFGAGIPISLKRPQSPSTFNIGVELGQRGTTDNNLVREDYLVISFGLTLMPHFRNPWFVKRKYD